MLLKELMVVPTSRKLRMFWNFVWDAMAVDVRPCGKFSVNSLENRSTFRISRPQVWKRISSNGSLWETVWTSDFM